MTTGVSTWDLAQRKPAHTKNTQTSWLDDEKIGTYFQKRNNEMRQV